MASRTSTEAFLTRIGTTPHNLLVLSRVGEGRVPLPFFNFNLLPGKNKVEGFIKPIRRIVSVDYRAGFTGNESLHVIHRQLPEPDSPVYFKDDITGTDSLTLCGIPFNGRDDYDLISFWLPISIPTPA